jgi:GntR family transcriptional regulator
VSTGTVRKALEVLEAERLVARRQGKGTFVMEHGSDAVAARFGKLRRPDGRRLTTVVEPAAISEGTANAQECNRLHLDAGELVYRLHWFRSDGRHPLVVENATLPAALFPGLRDKNNIDGNLGNLARDYGILLGKAVERISLCAVPPPTVVEALGVPLGTPLMLLDRVLFTLDDRPVQWRMAYCHLSNGYYLAERR